MSKKNTLKVSKLFNLFSVESKDEDVVLMQRLQSGDFASFEELYMKYRKPIYSYFFAKTSSVEEAEELLQDTFMKVLDKKHSFRFESKFSTWLWTLSRNLFIDKYRSDYQHQGNFEVQDSENESIVENLDSGLDSAEEMLIKKAEEAGLKKCIDELSDNQKESLLLKIYSDLSYDEISKNLGLTVSSIKSLLVRSKEKLLNCLKNGGHHEK